MRSPEATAEQPSIEMPRILKETTPIRTLLSQKKGSCSFILLCLIVPAIVCVFGLSHFKSYRLRPTEGMARILRPRGSRPTPENPSIISRPNMKIRPNGQKSDARASLRRWAMEAAAATPTQGAEDRPNLKKRYDLVSFAIFRNEEMLISEWLEHNLRQGVEHIFLIDHGPSDDKTRLMLREHEEAGHVSVHTYTDRSEGAQTRAYMHFLPMVSALAEWIIMCDIDEFIISKSAASSGTFVPVRNVLQEYFENKADFVQFPNLFFGSSGHIAQPFTVVCNFKKRANYSTPMENAPSFLRPTLTKYIIRSSAVERLDVHTAITKPWARKYWASGEAMDPKATVIKYNLTEANIPKQLIASHHYRILGKEWYLSVRGNRGNVITGQLTRSAAETENEFNTYDAWYNDIDDGDLASQAPYCKSHENGAHAADTHTIFWNSSMQASLIHIPKTGGTTVEMVLREALETKFIPTGERCYFAVRTNAAKFSAKRLYITVLRSPREHVLSQFNHCARLPRGNASEDGFAVASTFPHQSFPRWLQHFENVEQSDCESSHGGECLSLADFNCYDPRNMQARTLSCVHHGNFASHHVRSSDVGPIPNEEIAISALNTFDWVGIVEMLDESLCVFYFRYFKKLPETCTCKADDKPPDGEARPAPEHTQKFIHLNEAKVPTTTMLHQLDKQVLTQIDRFTSIDAVLYKIAVRRMVQEIRLVEQITNTSIDCKGKGNALLGRLE